jgi:hypothetical protein
LLLSSQSRPLDDIREDIERIAKHPNRRRA